MKIVIAPDSFKECMPSPQVAACMATAAGNLFKAVMEMEWDSHYISLQL